MDHLLLPAVLLGEPDGVTVLRVPDPTNNTVSDLRLLVAANLISSQITVAESNRYKLYDISSENVSSSDPRLRNDTGSSVQDLFPGAIPLDPLQVIGDVFPAAGQARTVRLLLVQLANVGRTPTQSALPPSYESLAAHNTVLRQNTLPVQSDASSPSAPSDSPAEVPVHNPHYATLAKIFDAKPVEDVLFSTTSPMLPIPPNSKGEYPHPVANARSSAGPVPIVPAGDIASASRLTSAGEQSGASLTELTDSSPSFLDTLNQKLGYFGRRPDQRNSALENVEAREGPSGMQAGVISGASPDVGVSNNPTEVAPLPATITNAVTSPPASASNPAIPPATSPSSITPPPAAPVSIPVTAPTPVGEIPEVEISATEQKYLIVSPRSPRSPIPQTPLAKLIDKVTIVSVPEVPIFNANSEKEYASSRSARRRKFIIGGIIVLVLVIIAIGAGVGVSKKGAAGGGDSGGGGGGGGSDNESTLPAPPNDSGQAPGTLLRTINLEGSTHIASDFEMQLSPDGRYLVVAYNYRLQVWDTTTWKTTTYTKEELHTGADGVRNNFGGLSVSVDGKQVFTLSSDGVVRGWAVEGSSGTPATYSAGSPGTFMVPSFRKNPLWVRNADGVYGGVGGSATKLAPFDGSFAWPKIFHLQGESRLFAHSVKDLESGAPFRLYEYALTYPENTRTVATVVNTTTLENPYQSRPASNFGSALANSWDVSPDRRSIFQAYSDRLISHIDLSTGKIVSEFGLGSVMEQQPYSLAVSPDGNHVFTGHYPKSQSIVVQWDVATGKEVRRFEGHPYTGCNEPKDICSGVLAVAVKGKLLYSADTQHIRQWAI
ncbi:hypothetical protein HK097_011600 [Rhizophlyctis rosea]|uniref:Uncharacterized protein n=1 Tax=Rhizophlyctis rosea TaxID=64517 RepID=A0AAD5WZ46_9FUNG|nr:hypothetical protein HK097_011600 [Rhizophlyctis rosea]